MYYIINNEERYYAGKCYSDKRTPVLKNHSTRAMGFETMKEALDFASDEKIFFFGVEYKGE